mmetsp:Transcript_67813/g.180389  ORF Transcript_67813/g.180389 Transcript_67813/m.180389 type:complete len:218 (-) Transcript_67813:212-865(-)
MERVARMRVSLLKYGSCGLTQPSSDLVRAREQETSSWKPCGSSERLSTSKEPGVGCGWRRSIAHCGKARVVSLPTEMLASSMNSSTIELASRRVYMPTSVGSRVSESRTKRTSGLARVRAPAAVRFALSCLAIELRVRRPRVSGSLREASSIRTCASSYESAAAERMTVFSKRVERTLACSSITQMHEKASRSTLPWREHRSSPSRLGTMSMRLLTR